MDDLLTFWFVNLLFQQFWCCACVSSYRTGRLTRGDLQQNQAHHRGAVWSLHLDPLLREALSSLPCPLRRCSAPLLPPRDPTRAQIAPVLTSFLQICFISSFSVIIMLLSKWKRSLITITVTVHTPAWVSQQIHSRLEMPFQRNLSNENKREKESILLWTGTDWRSECYRNLERGVGIQKEVAGKQRQIIPSWNTL